MRNKGYLNHAINISVIFLSSIIFVLDYRDIRGGFLSQKLLVNFSFIYLCFSSSSGKSHKALPGTL